MSKSDDVISRHAAIDEIKKCRFVVDAIETIRALPPAQTERKTGKWLPDIDYLAPHFLCSACKASQKVETIMFKPIWRYCPRCGAEMGIEEAYKE